MNLSIRLETKSDYAEVENLTREAFWNLYAPGCDEHYLCHILRDHEDFIHDLDFVAELDGKILGSIMYTKSWLFGDDQSKVPIVSFGPLCVHPDVQRKGIGTALIAKTRAALEDMGIPAIAIFGDPHNYCKHGFRNGLDYRVSTMDGDYPLGLLVLELQPGFFGRQNWKLRQSEVFQFDQEKAQEFDKGFRAKEKKVHYSQELFRMQIRASLRDTQRETQADNILAHGIASQMLASLYTLKDCMDRCPHPEWQEKHKDYPFSQVVFHVLFDCDLSLCDELGDIKTQEFHKSNGVFFADYEELEDKPRKRLYERDFLEKYYEFCLCKIKAVLESQGNEALLIPKSDIYHNMTRSERYINAIRHIQHHTAQLGLRLQYLDGQEMAWVSKGYSEAT